jgi:hypothetical protein
VDDSGATVVRRGGSPTAPNGDLAPDDDEGEGAGAEWWREDGQSADALCVNGLRAVDVDGISTIPLPSSSEGASILGRPSKSNDGNHAVAERPAAPFTLLFNCKQNESMCA